MTNKNIIIEKSSILFLTNGIRVTSMDDIASECNISKKTIYKHFESKKDLIDQIIDIQIKEFEYEVKNCSVNSSNAIIELNYFFDYFKEIISTVSSAFYRDIKRNYPINYEMLLKFKDCVIIPFLQKNILRGKKEKLYKYDLNSKEVSQSYNLIYQILISDNFFLIIENNPQAIDFLNTLFLHRLISVKGLKFLKH